MGENMVSVISCMVMGGFCCILAVMTLIKPQWIVGKDTWYRVRKEKEEAYKKKSCLVHFFDAAIFFLDGVLAYLGVHTVIIWLILIVIFLVDIIVYKLMPKKESYFYDNSDK
ncbi:MAG: hypothetical protein Q4G58_11195 [bacterium]|nr:hypothetical protein [bacterium]